MLFLFPSDESDAFHFHNLNFLPTEREREKKRTCYVETNKFCFTAQLTSLKTPKKRMENISMEKRSSNAGVIATFCLSCGVGFASESDFSREPKK